MAKTGSIRPVRRARAGDVYVFPMYFGFGALLVVVATEATADVCWLEGYWPETPSEAEVAAADLGAATRVENRVPWWATRLTTLAVASADLPTTELETNWAPIALQSYRTWHWKNISPVARAATDAAVREANLGLEATRVEIDLGAGGVEVPKSLSWAALGPAGPIAMPLAPARTEWSGLDILENLQWISVEGPAPGLVDYLRGRPEIVILHWHRPGPAPLDLRGTRLTELRLVDAKSPPTKLFVPASLLDLNLAGGDLEVLAEHPKFPLRVNFFGARLPERITGLDELEQFSAAGLREADIMRLAQFPNLKRVTLRSRFGSLLHGERFDALPSLEELVLDGLYGLTADHFPALPALPCLTRLSVSGIERESVGRLREELQAIPLLEIKRAKPQAWIARNLDNPFADWVDDDARLGKAAAKAWKLATTAAEEAGRSVSKARAKAVVTGLIDALNRIHARHPLDTMRGEEALEAVESLGRRFDAIEPAECAAWIEALAKWFD